MRRSLPGIYILFLVLFGLLCYLVSQSNGLPGDNTVSQWLQDINLPLFTPMMKAVSYPGKYIPAGITVTLLVIVLLFLQRRLEAILVIVLLASTGLVNESLKW